MAVFMFIVLGTMVGCLLVSVLTFAVMTNRWVMRKFMRFYMKRYVKLVEELAEELEEMY